MLATALSVLITLTSNPGETMDDFIVRIAPTANAMTVELGSEVCGAVGEYEGTYTLQLEKGRGLSCKIHWVAGNWTGFIFHTHPEHAAKTWAPADLRAAPGYLSTPEGVYWQSKGRFKTLKTVKVD